MGGVRRSASHERRLDPGRHQMLVIPRLRQAWVTRHARRSGPGYASLSADAATAHQLDAFNRQWQGISTVIPYWTRLRREHHLPRHFESWLQIREILPVLERSHLQTQLSELTAPGSRPQAWRATGGSTGVPVRIPVWRSETRVAAADMWQARSWFGITPADRAFLVWGHSHLLGRGLLAMAKGRLRQWKDTALGYRRWSAYRMGDADLARAASELLAFRPAYVLGYAVALDRFARVNRSLWPELRGLHLKAVIATGESFPRTDSASLLHEAFGCPVRMEYGSVETGPVAHETLEGGYRVFWARYAAEALPSETIPGAWELALTSLYPRCVPLIRYRIGDLVVPSAAPSAVPLLEFAAVAGRCNDTIELREGRRVHSEAIAHALRAAPVTGFQLARGAGGDLRLLYTSPAVLTAAALGDVRGRLRQVAEDLGSIPVEHVERLQQTMAGKTRTVDDRQGAPGRISSDAHS